MTDEEIPIRMGTPADEVEIMVVCHELHTENGIFHMVESRVRDRLKQAFEQKGGMIGIIGPPGGIEALMFLVISNAWYTDQWHLEELFSFVRPDYRRSTHAKRLVKWGKECADACKLPALIGILSNDRTEAKVRLYRRQLGDPAGAFFLYVPPGLNIKEPPPSIAVN